MSSTKTKRHQQLRRWYDTAKRSNEIGKFQAEFKESVQQCNDLDSRFSVRELFEQFVPDGREAIRLMQPGQEGGWIQESAEVINTGLFANLFGQITYTMSLREFEKPIFIGDRLVTVIPTNFSGEKVPGVGRIADDVEVVGEGNPYPNALFGEEWVETPATTKRGVIVPITKEALFFDNTSMILRRAAQAGESIAMNREKRILDAVFGITTIYRRNGQAAEATYQSDNTLSNTLTDWVSIDAAQQKFNLMTDPTNGEPISVGIDMVITPKALETLARRIQNATMTRQGTASGANQTYVQGASLEAPFELATNQYVRSRTGSDSTWFAGQPKKAFAYMQNWPMQVVQADASSEANFNRDVVVQYKVSERGAPAVLERRYMVKCT